MRSGPLYLTKARPCLKAQSNHLSFPCIWKQSTASSVFPRSWRSQVSSGDHLVTFPTFHFPGVGGKLAFPQPHWLVSLGILFICIPVSARFNVPKPVFKAITSLKFMKWKIDVSFVKLGQKQYLFYILLRRYPQKPSHSVATEKGDNNINNDNTNMNLNPTTHSFEQCCFLISLLI